ncbi:hypothetical protein Barb7_03163 [Bacteroidales bacterium Barb7]|nr:hypothetical protein Barb7_03163 [Bacteroidales bacterium Barb7]
MSNGIAHPHFAGTLDARNDIAHITRPYLGAGRHGQFEDTHLVGIILLLGGNELHMVALVDHAVHYLEIGNNTAKRVEHRIEYQALEWCFWVALRRRHFLHNGVQYLINTLSRLAAGTED